MVVKLKKMPQDETVELLAARQAAWKAYEQRSKLIDRELEFCRAYLAGEEPRPEMETSRGGELLYQIRKHLFCTKDAEATSAEELNAFAVYVTRLVPESRTVEYLAPYRRPVKPGRKHRNDAASKEQLIVEQEAMDWAVSNLHWLTESQVNECYSLLDCFDMLNWDVLNDSVPASLDSELETWQEEGLTREQMAVDVGTVAGNSPHNKEFIDYVGNCVGERFHEE